MIYQYNEILERMKETFEEESGYPVEEISDIGIRMRVLAGEIYSLQSNIEWLRKQMFPDTATGEQLDLHAAQRGLSRKKGVKAHGLIAFRLDAPLDYPFIVPKDTICTTSDGSKNFISLQDVTISAGATYATVRAEAEKTGKIYNVKPDSITTIVTYFSVGIRIMTSSVFVGGEDDENDESLRKRILTSFQNISNGANEAYYLALAQSVDGVQSASVINEAGTTGRLLIYVAGRGAVLNETQLSTLNALFTEQKCAGTNIVIYHASLVPVNINCSIAIQTGASFEDVSENLTEALEKFFLDKNIGENITLAELGEIIFHVNGVKNYSFISMSDSVINQNELAVIGNLQISQLNGGT